MVIPEDIMFYFQMLFLISWCAENMKCTVYMYQLYFWATGNKKSDGSGQNRFSPLGRIIRFCSR